MTVTLASAQVRQLIEQGRKLLPDERLQIAQAMIDSVREKPSLSENENVSSANDELMSELPDYEQMTDEEWANYLQPQPKTGAEIMTSGDADGWENSAIPDSAVWLENQRENHRQKLRRMWEEEYE